MRLTPTPITSMSGLIIHLSSDGEVIIATEVQIRATGYVRKAKCYHHFTFLWCCISRPTGLSVMLVGAMHGFGASLPQSHPEASVLLGNPLLRPGCGIGL